MPAAACVRLSWQCRAAILGAVLLCLASCGRKQKSLEEMNLTQDEAERILAEISSRKAQTSAPKAPTTRPPPPSSTPGVIPGTPGSPPLASASNAAPLRATEHEQQVEDTLLTERWIIDGLVDVSVAAPSTATERGVVLVNGRDEMFIAQLGPLSNSKKPDETPIAPLPDTTGAMHLGRGPTIADGYAHWVTDHRLLRRPLKAPHEPLDVLAQDARVATRTSALPASGKRPTWVGYIALPTVKNGPLRAKLWFGQNSNTLPLSEAAESTLSLDLLESGGMPYVLSLEARTGQSTLHLRSLAPETPPRVAEHRIVWVGGNANPTTELRAITPSDRGLTSLVPLERGITDFGLELIDLGAPEAPKTPDVAWVPYPNGINPAPVDAATVCKRQVVLFARPSTALPGSPQELVLGEFIDGALEQKLVLSRSKAFYDLSIAPLAGGALVSFVADHRTWARSIRCVR